MAAKSFNLSEMDALFSAMVVSDRSLRLRALNIFRDANGKDAVDYVVNAHLPSREAYDTALSDFATDLGNGGGATRTLETNEVEVVLAHLLVAGRADRLAVLNLIRDELELDTPKYLVNVHLPSREVLDAALTGIEEDTA